MLVRECKRPGIRVDSYLCLDGIAPEATRSQVKALCNSYTGPHRPTLVMCFGFLFVIFDALKNPNQFFVFLKVKGKVALNLYSLGKIAVHYIPQNSALHYFV